MFYLSIAKSHPHILTSMTVVCLGIQATWL